ncbi:MAG: putative S-layer protein [Candidatus Pacearchaeota archaeon]|jgi:hypothetical protein
MNSKLFTVGLFAILLIGFASAAFTVSTSSITFTNSASQIITVSNTDSLPLTLVVPSSITVTGENGYSALSNIADNGIVTIAPLSSKQFTITPQSVDFSNFNIGQQYASSLTLTNSNNALDSKTVSVYFTRGSYCQFSDKGSSLVLEDVNIDNSGLYGGDEDNWYPFEPISVDVTIRNRASDRVNDIVVSYGLYNKNTNEFIIEKDMKNFDLNDGDEKTVSFNFSVDPRDLDSSDDPNDYTFYVKAYSDDLGEDQQCTSESRSITIPRDSNFVIIGNFQMSETVQCDETATVSYQVWNIGDTDEQDISLLVDGRGKIPSLKNQKFDIGDLDILDSKKGSFDIEIPKNLTEGNYYLDFKILNEDGTVFENDDGKESTISQLIKVQGNCELPTSVSITANLESDSYAAEASTVKVTVKNTGLGDVVAVVDATNLDSWATLGNVDPKTLTLNPGESGDSVITLTPDAIVSGNKDFKIKVSYGDKITEQTFSINVQPKRSFFGSFSFGSLFGDNWFIWVVAALNIILVLLIVVIAIKIAKK